MCLYIEISMRQSKYFEELEKFLKSPVTVIDSYGNTYEGICHAISDPHLNVVLMTPTNKILIKGIVSISRKRSPQ